MNNDYSTPSQQPYRPALIQTDTSGNILTPELRAEMIRELEEYGREEWKRLYAEKHVQGFSVCGINLEKPGEIFKLLLALEASDRRDDHDD